uniref:28S ribosomal protein S22, mitochondrial n=1 Tax=Ditylenchus dipsaci TaxID=166011 RepID=A0A915E5E1_9BILA
MLIFRSVAVWRLNLNCVKNRACSSTDTVRFKSAWIKEVRKKPRSAKEITAQQSDDHQPAKQSADEEDVDVEKMFIDGRVQRLLKNLIGMDIDKIYSDRVVSSVERKHYALMTDDMITHIRTKMMRRGERFQQFVPVKEPRSSIPTVLANEEGLDGFDNTKYVFTDITFDATSRNRIVVVREPNGILRNATPEEHDRMNRTYYPSEEKPVLEPKVFTDPSFSEALKGNRHEIVMDWAAHFLNLMIPAMWRCVLRCAMKLLKIIRLMFFALLVISRRCTNNLADVANAIRLIKVMHPRLPIPSIQGENYERIIEIFLEAQKSPRKRFSRLISLMDELKRPK